MTASPTLRAAAGLRRAASALAVVAAGLMLGGVLADGLPLLAAVRRRPLDADACHRRCRRGSRRYQERAAQGHRILGHPVLQESARCQDRLELCPQPEGARREASGPCRAAAGIGVPPRRPRRQLRVRPAGPRVRPGEPGPEAAAGGGRSGQTRLEGDLRTRHRARQAGQIPRRHRLLRARPRTGTRPGLRPQQSGPRPCHGGQPGEGRAAAQAGRGRWRPSEPRRPEPRARARPAGQVRRSQGRSRQATCPPTTRPTTSTTCAAW